MPNFGEGRSRRVDPNAGAIVDGGRMLGTRSSRASCERSSLLKGQLRSNCTRAEAGLEVVIATGSRLTTWIRVRSTERRSRA
jgi:hypothetical protein